MPVEQPYFKWRVRTTLRQIVNAPCPAPDVLPSVYVTLGWSLYENAEPQEMNKVMSVLISDNQFPDFNQQLLLHNPKEVIDISGFLWIVVMDRNRQDLRKLGTIKVPLDSLKPFQPLQLSAKLPNPDGKIGDDPSTDCIFQLDICLEKPIMGQVDQLCYSVINWVQFDPLPSNVKRFCLALVCGDSAQFEIPWHKYDCEDPTSMTRVMEAHRNAAKSCFISPWMRTTPDAVENMFKALTFFPMPKSYFTKQVSMYLLIKDEQEASLMSLPSECIGYSEPPKDVNSLGNLFDSILYEPGHPEDTCDVVVDWNHRAAQALQVNGNRS